MPSTFKTMRDLSLKIQCIFHSGRSHHFKITAFCWRRLRPLCWNWRQSLCQWLYYSDSITESLSSLNHCWSLLTTSLPNRLREITPLWPNSPKPLHQSILMEPFHIILNEYSPLDLPAGESLFLTLVIWLIFTKVEFYSHLHNSETGSRAQTSVLLPHKSMYAIRLTYRSSHVLFFIFKRHYMHGNGTKVTTPSNLPWSGLHTTNWIKRVFVDCNIEHGLRKRISYEPFFKEKYPENIHNADGCCSVMICRQLAATVNWG